MGISSASKSQRELLFEQLDPNSKELVLQFDKTLVLHRNLQNARNALRKAILFPTNRRIIAVLGPGGVGKSTLLELMKQELWDIALQDSNWDEGCIPTASVEMKIIAGKPFDWGSYLVECHEAFNEVLIKYKKRIDYSKFFPEKDPRIPQATTHTVGIRYDDEGNLFIGKDARVNGLFYSFINVLHYRKPLCFMNDEAQHLTAVVASRSFLDQMNAIKSLSNASNTVIVLFGIYDMHILLNLNDQLSRRTRVIEFPRYDAHSKKDFLEFEKLLDNFQRILPCELHYKLRDNSIWYYERSCGVPGVLKDWLVDALCYYLKDPALCDFAEACLETAPLDHEVVNRISKIRAGELAFRPSREAVADARSKLGIKPEAIKPPSAKKSSRRKVGVPAPKNYRVGNEQE